MRQATQNMSLALVTVLLVPALGIPALPADMRRQVIDALVGLDWLTIGIGVASILVVPDVALFAAATVRFQRTRLILD